MKFLLCKGYRRFFRFQYIESQSEQLVEGQIRVRYKKLGGQALKDGIKAGDIIKEVSKQVGGSGGGRPEMAQGQGRNLNALHGAFDDIKESLK